jgi:hypothetical protein
MRWKRKLTFNFFFSNYRVSFACVHNSLLLDDCTKKQNKTKFPFFMSRICFYSPLKLCCLSLCCLLYSKFSNVFHAFQVSCGICFFLFKILIQLMLRENLSSNQIHYFIVQFCLNQSEQWFSKHQQNIAKKTLFIV